MALIILAALGLALVAVGAGLIWFPVGLIVAGVELVGCAYLIAEQRS